MIAAVYARKSTDQNLPDAEKSVTRQVEHATVYAAREGLDIAEVQHQEDRQESADPRNRHEALDAEVVPHCWARVVSRCRICSSSTDSSARQSPRPPRRSRRTARPLGG